MGGHEELGDEHNLPMCMWDLTFLAFLYALFSTLPGCPQPTSFSLVCLVCQTPIFSAVLFWEVGYLNL